jgi:hypothetical protein
VALSGDRRTPFESIAERKLRRQQLTDDGNLEISGRSPLGARKRSLDFPRPKAGLDRSPSLRSAVPRLFCVVDQSSGSRSRVLYCSAAR